MNTSKEFMFDLASEACNSAIKNGADFAKAKFSYDKNVSAQMEDSKLKYAEQQDSQALILYAWKSGGLATSITEDISKEGAIRLGENAAELANLTDPDSNFHSIPEKTASYPDLQSSLYDENVKKLGVKDGVDLLLKMREVNKTLEPEANVGGEVQFYTAFTAIVNTNGVEAYHQDSVVSTVNFVVLKKSDEDVGLYYDYDYSRSLKDLGDIETLAEKTTKKARKFLGGRKITTQTLPIILSPDTVASSFRHIFGSLSGYQIIKKRSYFADYLNKQIASNLLTIIDNPLVKGGLYSSAFDEDGCSRNETPIIEDGVLSTFLHSYYTSKIMNMKNTAHSVDGRNSAPSNLQIKPGDKSIEEIIKGIDKGIYVEMGTIMPDSITGEISSNIDLGFLIENGKLKYPVKNCIMGMNIFDFLKNIEDISSDFREVAGNIYPAMLVKDIKIAGAAG